MTGQDHLSGKVKLVNLVSVDYTPSLHPVSRLSPGEHERKYTTTFFPPSIGAFKKIGKNAGALYGMGGELSFIRQTANSIGIG